MAEPLDMFQHMQNRQFIAHRKIVVLFAATSFDAVHTKDGTKIYDDIEECQEDINLIEEVLQHYPISEDDRVIKLVDKDACIDRFDELYLELVKELSEAEQNDENVLLISVFAGHGILKNGTQYLVTNEFLSSERKLFA